MVDSTARTAESVRLSMILTFYMTAAGSKNIEFSRDMNFFLTQSRHESVRRGEERRGEGRARLDFLGILIVLVSFWLV